MQNRCEQALMARGAITEVVYCRDCRVFHVNVGVLTVHFEATALRDLRDTLSAALAAHARMASAMAAESAPPRQRVKLAH